METDDNLHKRDDGGGNATVAVRGTITTVRRTWPWLGLVARLLVGGVWLVAGWVKITDTASSVRAVRAYQLLPEWMVPTVGRGLPVLEICIGLLLVTGLAQRFAASLSGILLVAFIIGISAAWARGLQIECGCFGGGGAAGADAADKYPGEIARDVGLLALSAAIGWRPGTRWSVDSLINPTPSLARAR